MYDTIWTVDMLEDSGAYHVVFGTLLGQGLLKFTHLFVGSFHSLQILRFTLWLFATVNQLARIH